MPRETTVYMHHKDDHRIPVSVHVSSLKNDGGEIIGGVELFTDISNNEANAVRVEELQQLALLGNLTELANRHYIDRELIGRMEEFERYIVSFGILLMDIDHFKRVNDSDTLLYGSKAGGKTGLLSNSLNGGRERLSNHIMESDKAHFLIK